MGPRAIAEFKKYHPLKVSISYTDPYQTTAVLKTLINVNNTEEMAEITNWLLFLGGDIKVREMPEEVSDGIKERDYSYIPDNYHVKTTYRCLKVNPDKIK